MLLKIAFLFIIIFCIFLLVMKASFSHNRFILSIYEQFLKISDWYTAWCKKIIKKFKLKIDFLPDFFQIVRWFSDFLVYLFRK